MSNWSTLDVSGLDGVCLSLLLDSSNHMLYAGGVFTQAGGLTANRIAKYDTNTGTWSALDVSGLSGGALTCNAFAFDSQNAMLYVGGGFTLAGGLSANYIAKYNTLTGTWSNLGADGLGNICNALAFDSQNNALYVGGAFTTADGSTANYIAKYNTLTSSWSALAGSGLNNTCSALVFDSQNNALYVGGNFTTANGSTANRIAKYNTSTETWSNLGAAGLGSSCFALAFDSPNNMLYVGGQFTTADGSTANRIAKYNTSTETWSNLGAAGLDNSCRALVLDSQNNTLYVGGQFVQAVDISANRIAEYDTNTGTWSNLGAAGLDNTCRALALDSSNNDLYVGGVFTTADGSTANRIARYDIGTPPSPNSAPTITSGSTATVYENVSTSYAVYTVTATDVDVGQTLTYSISGGADAAQFDISSSTGIVTFKISPNFEAPTDASAVNVYHITVRATDNATLPLYAEKAVAIAVTDVNEIPTAPTSISTSTSSEQISITFTGPTNYGGTAVLRYEYSTSSIFTTFTTYNSTVSPLDISGLTNGQSYTYYLRAVNAAGQGASSSAITKYLPDASDLKASGSTAEELKALHFTCAELTDAGYSAYEIESAGYPFTDLVDAGFTSIEPVDSTQLTYALTESQFTNVVVNTDIQINNGVLVSSGQKQLFTTSADGIAITKN